MPIDVLLKDELGVVLGRAGGDGLLEMIAPPFGDSSSEMLRFLNPYGNLILNAAQAIVLRRELAAYRNTLSRDDDRHTLELIDALALRCAEEHHVYLWFVGD